MTNIPLYTQAYTLQSRFSLIFSPKTLTGTFVNPSEGYLYFHNSLLVVFCLPFPQIISQLQFPFLHSAQESYLLSVFYRQNVWFKSKSKMVLEKKKTLKYIHPLCVFLGNRQLTLSAQLSLLYSRAELFPSATLPSHFE